MGVPSEDPSSLEEHQLDLDGYSLPGVVSRHEKPLASLTTPAPTQEGRPPPKKLKGKIDHGGLATTVVLRPIALP